MFIRRKELRLPFCCLLFFIFYVIIAFQITLIENIMKPAPYSIFLDDLRSIDMVYKKPKSLNGVGSALDSESAIDVTNMPFFKDFHMCRTMEEAVALIEEKGILPYYISFDNDLGQDEHENPLKEGIDFAHWIVEQVLDGVYTLPDNFEFFVHSANTIAGPEIKILLDNFQKHLAREKNPV